VFQGDGHERQEEVPDHCAPVGGRTECLCRAFLDTACALGKAIAAGLLVLLFFAKFLAGIAGVHFLL
jgi:hypothetical protein